MTPNRKEAIVKENLLSSHTKLEMPSNEKIDFNKQSITNYTFYNFKIAQQLMSY